MDGGICKDDLASLTAGVRSALTSADLLVTTGGVSMGDRDLLRQVMIINVYLIFRFSSVFIQIRIRGLK